MTVRHERERIQSRVDQRGAEFVRWMLEHGEPDAREFLPQLERAQVLPTRCPCGCASMDFSIDGQPKPSANSACWATSFSAATAS